MARSISHKVLTHPANRAHPRRALARAVYWQVHKRVWRRPVDIDFEGFRLRCHPGSGSASNVWYFTSRFDFAEMAFLERYLRPGDHVLDVGANIGTYTLFMASLVGSTGHVTAFEPEPRNARRLAENVEINGLSAQVTVHPNAVADCPGTVPFFADRDVSNGLATQDDPRGRTIEVSAVRLDDVVTAHPRLQVAKLDVEGAEVMALAGAAGLLAAGQPRIWLTEVITSQLRWFGESRESLVTAFGEAGYVPCSVDDTSGRLVWDVPVTKGNVFFVARNAAAEVEQRLAARPRR
ncbi:MAG: FkbM family methyltransferase [Aquihabitans sp.]